MAARSFGSFVGGWRHFAQYFGNRFKGANASFFKSWRASGGRYPKPPHLLFVIPAAGLLRSISFFQKKKEPLETAEEAEKSRLAAELQTIISKADALYNSHKFDEVLQYLQKHANVESDEVLWRLARALTDKSKLTSDKSEKKKLLFEAFEAVKRGLALNEKNFACHKWYAILMDKTAEYEGTKARISNAYVVKEHFMRASELNPKDATTLYTLGVWCFLFADMPWYQRKIAEALFATPPTSSYDEALRYFHRAEEMDPNFYSKNLLYLGKTYSRLGNKKLALLYLTRAHEYAINTPDDAEAHKEAAELLKKMGVKVEEQSKAGFM